MFETATAMQIYNIALIFLHFVINFYRLFFVNYVVPVVLVHPAKFIHTFLHFGS